jgi:hypothetical protein
MLGAITLTLGQSDGMSSTGTVDGADDGSTLTAGIIGEVLSGNPGSAGARLGLLVGNGTDQKGSADSDMLSAITLTVGISDGMSSTGTVDGDNNGTTLANRVVGDVLDNGTPGSAGAILGATVGTGSDHGATNSDASNGDRLGFSEEILSNDRFDGKKRWFDTLFGQCW